jgi:hypothetical protein
MSNTDKRTASQRIEDLERAVMSLFQVNNNMAKDLTMAKDALKLLNQRVSAVIKLLSNNTTNTLVNEDTVDGEMKNAQMEELKQKVTNLVNQGLLVPAKVVGEGTFIVGTENEKDNEDGTPGKVQHPRVQCTLASLSKDVQDQLVGAKVGDTISFKDVELVFKLQEVYQIVNPTPPGAPVEQPAAPAAAPAPDAAQQSSSDAAQAAAPAADPNTQAAGN